MTKVITIYDDELYLRQISKEVDLSDEKLKKDILILEEYCRQNDVMAMAAIQLGIPKRLVYLKNTDLERIRRSQYNIQTEEDQNYNEAKILINPIIRRCKGLTEYWEACASCLDNTGLVERPYEIEIEYYDLEGNKNVELIKGFKSTVLSHELDHLDGILHMDIAKEIKVLKLEDRKKLRQEQDYKVISKDCEYTKPKIKKLKK